MSDEEEDYMSENFVAESLGVKEDVRPGLVYSRTKQREIAVEKERQRKQEEHRLKNRPTKQIEAERREEGLKEAIGTENKGFALLQKMGYKPGEGIGKSSSGRVEPVGVTLKVNRAGLGQENAIKLLAERKAALRLENLRKEPINVNDYRIRKSRMAEERRDIIDLSKCQRVCNELDSNQNIDEPQETWFWPKREKEKKDSDESEDEEEEEEEFDVSQRLTLLTGYLREAHNYCLWCGTTYDDDKDLRDVCPGPTRDDH